MATLQGLEDGPVLTVQPAFDPDVREFVNVLEEAYLTVDDFEIVQNRVGVGTELFRGKPESERKDFLEKVEKLMEKKFTHNDLDALNNTTQKMTEWRNGKSNAWPKIRKIQLLINYFLQGQFIDRQGEFVE